MQYTNPVVKGFYPDPSVCKVNNKYFMVCSSFQYFPGVPLFESTDLVNWKQIGHCLTRKSQIMLDKINSSGGVFAPTIRYNDGRFFMTTTNDTTHQNFYVWTDNIYGEWSEPIFVEQLGIDPSLYFENGKTYFLSNGQDDFGISGIVQCEIDIQTGKKLSPSKTIWQGSGGRYIESPHMYKINGQYYLVAAEGGTEYGHMVTYAKSNSVWGEFIGYPNNPVLTNRNLGGFQIQGVGHGDLIQDANNSWHMLHLGFRQTGQWSTFHHLGREVFLTPITFNDDGWFTAGLNGTTQESYEIQGEFEQVTKTEYTFQNTDWNLDWTFLRYPNKENYTMEDSKLTLIGTDITLDHVDSPTFIGIRQKDFVANISCDLKLDKDEAGLTLYMDENHHYDLSIKEIDSEFYIIERLNIGDIKCIQNKVHINSGNATLIINANNYSYTFGFKCEDEEVYLGTAQTRYLSSEVAGGFTGVIIGLYSCGKENRAEFTNFLCQYN